MNKKLILGLEFFLLYIFLVLGIHYKWITIHPFILLGLGFSYALFQLRGEFSALFLTGFEKEDLYFVLKRFFIIALFVGVGTYFLRPDKLFYVVKNRPKLILIVFFAYPLLSAIPQEVLYRSFFFKRYQSLFGPGQLIIFVNALCFSFLHVIYNNWVALTFTFVGNYLYTSTYLKKKSFGLVCIEHSLYGLLMFLIGLGDFFVLRFNLN